MNDLLLIHRVVLTHASYRIFLLATTVLGSLIGARHHRSVSCRVCWKIRNWIESTTSHVITSHWTIIYYICLGVSFMFNGYKLIICTRGWSEYLNIYLIIFLVFSVCFILGALHHVVRVQERAGHTPSLSAGTPAGRPPGWPLAQPLERALTRVVENTQW